MNNENRAHDLAILYLQMMIKEERIDLNCCLPETLFDEYKKIYDDIMECQQC